MNLTINKLKNPKVAIIIPTYNEEEDISKCLKSIENQSYKNIEVIIVDDGSIDKTCDIVKRFKKVKLIKGEHKGPGFSRNLGAKISKGEILIFIDADMILDKNYVKYIIKPICDGETIGTEDGFQLASNLNSVWSRCWGQYTKSFEEHQKRYAQNKKIFGQIFRAILKKEFFKMGGFDPTYGYADDLTFYLKYGKTSLRVKDAFCYHKNPETLSQVYKQSRWIGSSLNQKWVNLPILNYFVILLMVLLSPISVIILSIKKSYKIKNFKLIFPWMLIFITVRYFGTMSGLFRKITLDKNTR